MITPTAVVPNIFAVGDIQGCHASLEALLEKLLPLEPEQIWFAGDLVNRGPDSLASLRTIIGLGDRARCVLGNHDLHLLATAAGVRKPGRRDTLAPILAAPDADQLIDWLRQQPLAHYAYDHLLVHAGVYPSWQVEQTVSLSREVQTVLSGPNWEGFLANMYGNEPGQWQDELTGNARLRAIVNVLTRMRYLHDDYRLDFDCKVGLDTCPAHLTPWFDAKDRVAEPTTVVFGHWSTLGLIQRPKLLGLDTGCVWGGELTAVNLSTRSILQVPCPRAQDPMPG